MTMAASDLLEKSACSAAAGRVVVATHGRQGVELDPAYEIELTTELKHRLTASALLELYQHHSSSSGFIDTLVRRSAFRALARQLGHGLSLGCHVGIRHPETFVIGHGVFIGEQSILHGRFDGTCVIEDGAWIGPQCFIDARDLVIGAHVGLGPGVKILGSEHTGEPTDVPIIRTDLVISPVRIGAWADIGTNATILPGVNLGRGCIVGAGAVVTQDVADFAKVAGVPARVIGWRKPMEEHGE